MLRANRNPVAVIYVGGPSSSKTTVVDMFADETTLVSDGDIQHPLFYISDSFTAAAFVSQASNVAPDKLAKIDLLPRIKHKVLVTPELAPTFRGKDEVLVKIFKIITRVLDLQGARGRAALLRGPENQRSGLVTWHLSPAGRSRTHTWLRNAIFRP